MDKVKDPSRTPEDEIVRLVQEHQPALLRLCFVYLHDQALAEDAVQETFLKAYRHLDRFRGEASEKNWLSKIAINCCRDLTRSAWWRHTDRRITPDMLPEPSAQPTERDDTLTVAIMRLPRRLREAVVLYYLEDMTARDIAATLRISQQAVSNRLARARKALRQALNEEGEQDE
ncbi:MAG: sigma-70 family RNA polymerase sigma factor [Clostridia bacterium]|nr:sigma-70 family RNA polymerase sigma factor [Clostridia bacterium]